MNVVGPRDLRQPVTELVLRVEAGEEGTITVAGRPNARLVPVLARSWRQWDDVADLFSGPDDPIRDSDRMPINDNLHDPRLNSDRKSVV